VEQNGAYVFDHEQNGDHGGPYVGLEVLAQHAVRDSDVEFAEPIQDRHHEGHQQVLAHVFVADGTDDQEWDAEAKCEERAEAVDHEFVDLGAKPQAADNDHGRGEHSVHAVLVLGADAYLPFDELQGLVLREHLLQQTRLDGIQQQQRILQVVFRSGDSLENVEKLRGLVCGLDVLLQGFGQGGGEVLVYLSASQIEAFGLLRLIADHRLECLLLIHLIRVQVAVVVVGFQGIVQWIVQRIDV